MRRVSAWCDTFHYPGTLLEGSVGIRELGGCSLVLSQLKNVFSLPEGKQLQSQVRTNVQYVVIARTVSPFSPLSPIQRKPSPNVLVPFDWTGSSNLRVPSLLEKWKFIWFGFFCQLTRLTPKALTKKCNALNVLSLNRTLWQSDILEPLMIHKARFRGPNSGWPQRSQIKDTSLCFWNL